MEPPQLAGPGDAPPKQVAQAMDRLGHAARLIAEIRLGADRILEALLISNETQRLSEKAAELTLAEEAAMRHHFVDLRAVGRQLEESGVLSGALRSKGNSWGLHMPLVCPDGAVVAYAWKRQLAGQAGASAVDRARLALKAFTDQKRRFFPHLEDDQIDRSHNDTIKIPPTKQPRLSHRPTQNPNIDSSEQKPTLADILKSIETEAPGITISTYQRLEWLKRAESLSSVMNDNSLDQPKEQNLANLSSNFNNMAVIELVASGVFRVLVSLHHAGSTDPDAVAFFSPNEGGSYLHSRGLSVHHVFKHVTEYADKALQYFLSVDPNKALSHLLSWICSHQSLFTKACSKCSKMLMMDKSLAILLPPVHRSYLLTSKGHDQDFATTYHIGCSSYDV
jgi:mediator of RNA polymerase II transcription subunit 27